MTARVHVGWYAAALVAMVTACNGGSSGGAPPADEVPGKQAPANGDKPQGDASLRDQPSDGDRSRDERVVDDQLVTDGTPGTACPSSTDRSVAFDEVTQLGTAAQLREQFEALIGSPIPLRWTPEFGGTTTLAIEVEWGVRATLRDDQAHRCTQLRVPATLHVTSADGLLDETLAGDFVGLGGDGAASSVNWSGGHDATAVQDSAISRALITAFDQPYLRLDSFGMTLHFGDVQGELAGELSATTALDDAALVDALNNLAKFDSAWPQDVAIRERSQHADAFDDLCAGAQASPPTSSRADSDDALVDALTGHWVLCSGESTNATAHAGIAIAADGTWSHLAERDGSLIAQLGFGHEGTFEVIDTSDANGPNSRQLNLGGFPEEYGFSSDGRTLHLIQADSGYPGAPSYDNTYVRTDLSIGPPQLERDENERAGAAACEEGEAFVHGFSSVDDLRGRLAGSWAICSGGFRDGAVAIAFAADGTYRHLDADGDTIVVGRYELLDTSSGNGPGATQVSMTDDDAPFDRTEKVYGMYSPSMSDVPVKLLAPGETTVTVLSALP